MDPKLQTKNFTTLYNMIYQVLLDENHPVDREFLHVKKYKDKKLLKLFPIEVKLICGLIFFFQ